MGPWEMFLAGLLFLAVGAVTGGVQQTSLDAAGLGALCYLVVVGPWIGFTAYIRPLAHVPAAKAATYAYVNPMIAILLGWCLLDEPITPAILIGSAVIVVAVALVTSARVPAAAPVAVAKGGSEANVR